MITYWDYEQRSPEWYSIRAGKITASKVSDVISKGTGRARYMRELAAEMITGEPASSFSNAAMQWGIETEPQARAFYELATGNSVVETGFCTNETMPGCGVSPDGLIGKHGLIEIKCPATSTHIEYLMSGKLPSKYKAQLHMQLMITDRKWCDFVSFDPRVNAPYKNMMCCRVKRDEAYIADTLLPGITKFFEELDDMLAKLRSN